MFRFIRMIFLLIVLVAIIFGIYFWTMRVSLLESFLSKQLNAEISIQSVPISWNKVTVKNLKIKGAGIYSFQGTIELETSFWNFFSQPIHIKKLGLIDSVMTIELYNGAGSDNNWARLLSLLPVQGEQKVIIDKLVIDNLRFETRRANGKPITLPAITHVEIEDLGKGSALTIPAIARAVFQIVLSKVQDKPFLGSVLDHVAPMPMKKEEKGILGESVELLKRKTKEATDFLQELFSN